MTNTPKPPLDEEGVEPLPNRIRELPSAADRRTGRRILVWAAMAAAALAVIVLLVAGALAADAFRSVGDKDLAARLTGMELTDDVHWAYVFERGGRLTSVSMGRSGNRAWRGGRGGDHRSAQPPPAGLSDHDVHARPRAWHTE